MNKLDKFLYKNLSPKIGKIIDKLFVTNIGKRGTNYYHYYQQNDYSFDREKYCLIAVPKTGGWSFRKYTEKYNKDYDPNDQYLGDGQRKYLQDMTKNYSCDELIKQKEQNLKEIKDSVGDKLGTDPYCTPYFEDAIKKHLKQLDQNSPDTENKITNIGN